MYYKNSAVFWVSICKRVCKGLDKHLFKYCSIMTNEECFGKCKIHTNCLYFTPRAHCSCGKMKRRNGEISLSALKSSASIQTVGTPDMWTGYASRTSRAWLCCANEVWL